LKKRPEQSGSDLESSGWLASLMLERRKSRNSPISLILYLLEGPPQRSDVDHLHFPQRGKHAYRHVPTANFLMEELS
jgi:hypothetical protein